MFERTWTTMHALQCQFFFYLADLQRQNHAVDNVTMLALFSHSRPKRPPISACPRLFAWLPATARRESYLIWQRSSVPSFLARHVVLEYTFFAVVSRYLYKYLLPVRFSLILVFCFLVACKQLFEPRVTALPLSLLTLTGIGLVMVRKLDFIYLYHSASVWVEKVRGISRVLNFIVSTVFTTRPLLGSPGL